MDQLSYSARHNQVGYLKKSAKSKGCEQILNFLNSSYIRYALTCNPTIYESLVKQFWYTASSKTLPNGIKQIRATVENVEYTVTEASIRDSLHLNDASADYKLPYRFLVEGMKHIGYPINKNLTFLKRNLSPQWRFLAHHLLQFLSSKSGGWDQFDAKLAFAMICLSLGRTYNFYKLIFNGMVANVKSAHKLLMYPHFLQMVLNTEPANNTIYSSKPLKEKVFSNMRSGFTGIEKPLSVAMLFASSNLCACLLVQSEPQFAPVHTLELSSSASPPSTHEASSTMNVDDLLIIVPSLLTRVTSLELQLTKTTKKVKKLEHIVEELGIHITDFEDADSENSSKQGVFSSNNRKKIRRGYSC
jgi:hypothetical protein